MEYPLATEEEAAVRFRALVTGEKPIRYQWFHNGGLIPDATNSSYEIASVRPSQSGFYRVEAENAFGRSTKAAPFFEVLPHPKAANDSFAARQLIDSPFNYTANSAYASVEPGEPPPPLGTGGKSVWWTWTAPAAGRVTIDTQGTRYSTTMGVYRGTALASLELVASGAAVGLNGSYSLSFGVGRLQIFHISVDDYFGTGGFTQLRLTFEPDADQAAVPIISDQPQGSNATAGMNVTLTVSSTGTHPLTYEWRKNELALAKLNEPILVLTNLQSSDEGSYTVIIANDTGKVVSLPAVVKVAPSLPRITIAERDRIVTRGYPLQLTALASGTQPIKYQWMQDGIPITDATEAVLKRPQMEPEFAGAYTLRASNSEGATDSAPINISLVAAGVKYRWTTLAGSPGLGGRVDGRGAAARFNMPSGIALDSSGDLIVVDLGSRTLRKVTLDGQVTTAMDEGGRVEVFENPVDVDVLLDGSLLIQELSLRSTRYFGPGVRAYRIGGNWGLAAGRAGSVLQVADDRILRINADSTFQVMATGLKTAVDVIEDAMGNLFIAEANGYTITKIAPNGGVSFVAGKSGERGYADGPGAVARLVHPNSVSLDSQGNLFFADEFGYSIRRLATDGVVTTVGGGYPEYGSSDGVGSEARFSSPRRVLATPAGELYVVDTGNHTIRKGTPLATVPELTHLSAEFRNSRLELSWNQTSEQLVLESNDSLIAGIGWIPVIGSVETNGVLRVYSTQPRDGSLFYRLRAP